MFLLRLGVIEQHKTPAQTLNAGHYRYAVKSRKSSSKVLTPTTLFLGSQA